MILGKMKSLLVVLALALLSAPAVQAAPAKLSSAWMGEHETFAGMVRQAAGLGQGRRAGSGDDAFCTRAPNIVESLAAYDWAVAGCGAVPALTTPLSDYLYIIAGFQPMTNPPTTPFTCARTAPSLGPRGRTPAYPNVYGSRRNRTEGRHLVPQKYVRALPAGHMAAYASALAKRM